VVFDTIVNDQSTNISYNTATGEFTITQTGNYYVAWWVTTDGSEGPVNLAFAIQVNGANSVIGNAPVVTGQINGSALITIPVASAVITLVNESGALVAFATTAVQADIVIIEINA
jgi:hypothetical protein